MNQKDRVHGTDPPEARWPGAHTEAKTFDRKQAAAAWIIKRVKEGARPGAIEAAAVVAPLFGEVIRTSTNRARKSGGRQPKS
ncbi:hypothetical protein MB84_28905 (plasmid) [Pandoraea oxalativorans]|uniref:Uncharacterized protein n=1 Tax=Pandoraea oxalativorans TaxID=573737 RepID=A0A192B0Z5_9BURK|nr:hypothetical protein MB84_28905 [Pandoraea oxalativorans]